MAADIIPCEGTVLDEHRGLYRVEVLFNKTKHLVLARCSGRRIKIIPGDVVQVEVSPYDLKDRLPRAAGGAGPLE